ncbi:MAG TPA: trehalose-6-phosphate synthase, partial [Casimicrobiaceae bacterium]
MRLSLRFLVPLLVALAAFAYAAVPFVDGMMQRWFVRDLDERSALIAYTVEEPLRQLLADSTPSRIIAFFNRLTQDQQLYAVGYCPAGATKPIASERFPAEIGCHMVDANPRSDRPSTLNYGSLHLTAAALGPNIDTDGDLVVVNDTGFIANRRAETRRYLFYFFVALGAMVALITVVIGQLSWRGWVQGLRALLRGEGLWRPATAEASPELRPFARDVRELVRELERQYR